MIDSAIQIGTAFDERFANSTLRAALKAEDEIAKQQKIVSYATPPSGLLLDGLAFVGVAAERLRTKPARSRSNAANDVRCSGTSC